MYSRRSGFIRRSNSSRLTRHGTTQYLRDLNSTNVPPYMITPDKILEASNILKATGNVPIILDPLTKEYAGRNISLEETSSSSSVNLNTQSTSPEIDVQFYDLNFDSNEEHNTFIVDKQNMITSFDIPELLFSENSWRNAIEIMYQQSFTYINNGNEYPWYRSIRYLVLPYNISDQLNS